MDILFFDWRSIIQEVGPALSIIFFFTWRDWRRETRLCIRVEKLEDYQRETLTELVKKGTTAMVQSSEVLKWVGNILERVPTECPYVEPPKQTRPG